MCQRQISVLLLLRFENMYSCFTNLAFRNLVGSSDTNGKQVNCLNMYL